MKKILLLVVIAIITTSCSDTELEVDQFELEVDQFELTESSLELKPLEVKFSAYIERKSSDQNFSEQSCDIDKYKNASINIIYGGKQRKVSNVFNIGNCEFDSANNLVTEKFNGILTEDKGDLLFFSGYCLIQTESGAIKGELKVSSGTGKFGSSHGTLNIEGSIDFNSGHIIWVGKGLIPHK